MKDDYVKSGDEPDYKRCAICNHCNLDGEKRKKFVFDRATDEYHCMDCAKEIQSAIAEDEEDEYDWTHISMPYWKRKTGAFKGAQLAGAANRKAEPSLPEFKIWNEVDEVEDNLDEVVEDEPTLP